MAQDSTTPQETPAAPQPTASAPKKGVPTWFKIAIIAAGVFIVLGVGGFVALFYFVGSATKDAEKVSNQLVVNIQGDNPDAVYSVTSSEFQESTSSEELDEALEQISPLLQGKTTVIERKVVKHDNKEFVVLVYSVATDDGTKYLRVVLQKVDGEWKVFNFRASEEQLPADIE
jgi:hypothetical protein